MEIALFVFCLRKCASTLRRISQVVLDVSIGRKIGGAKGMGLKLLSGDA